MASPEHDRDHDSDHDRDHAGPHDGTHVEGTHVEGTHVDGTDPSRSELAQDVQATFCATLVDTWIALGLGHAVIAPGSRSTPLALQLAARPELAVHIVHDERSAAFIALGIGVASGVPAVVLCTSGTAATHFHAAVVEASLAVVPMIVITADRPPELHDVGAPQSIDQQRLYGSAPRWFHDPGVPSDAARHRWRRLAAQVWSRSVDADQGPVHLNLPFREPLVGTVGDLPEPLVTVRSGAQRPRRRGSVGGDDVRRVAALLAGRKGVLVAGRGVDDPAACHRLAGLLGWPILADHRSGCRSLPGAVGAFESLLRAVPFGEAHQPEVIVRLGEPPASKSLAQWGVASAAVQIQVDDSDRVFDPDHVIGERCTAPIGEWCSQVAEALDSMEHVNAPVGWAEGWHTAGAAAQLALHRALPDGRDDPLDEPTVARLLTSGALLAGTHLVIASSMPIRNTEWFGGDGAGLVVHANRGANGIDGVLATAIGVAAASATPTVVLLGDIALCHDASSLTALAGRQLDLTIVVVDNDGGGIFEFLPQASVLQRERFELLFGTAHGTDLVTLARAHGVPATTASTVGDLIDALDRPGTSLVHVSTDRSAAVSAHRRLHEAVAAALGARPG